jgi:hypothetical protein
LLDRVTTALDTLCGLPSSISMPGGMKGSGSTGKFAMA